MCHRACVSIYLSVSVPSAAGRGGCCCSVTVVVHTEHSVFCQSFCGCVQNAVLFKLQCSSRKQEGIKTLGHMQGENILKVRLCYCLSRSRSLSLCPSLSLPPSRSLLLSLSLSLSASVSPSFARSVPLWFSRPLFHHGKQNVIY